MEHVLEDLIQIIKRFESTPDAGALVSMNAAAYMLIEQGAAIAYELAKVGQWPRVLAAWQSHDMFARTCAHFVKPTSGWSFLHQAAWFGDEAAARELIRLGARVDLDDKRGRTPVDVAGQHRHPDLRGLLSRAAETAQSLWTAPTDAEHLPSSCAFSQARAWVPPRDDLVAYGGGVAPIRAGNTVWIDDFGRVLVGWHGTVCPPRGMGGESMIPGQD